MNRIFNQFKRFHFLFILIISSYFFSCVYFNTFYNAEASYKKALKIIEETPILDEVEVPEQAKKLLAEAMDNSKLVLKKYPDSKYVDDAVYIIAKSSFLRDEVAVSKSYFKQLLRDYPESKFYSLSKIWLTYTHLRMGRVDIAQTEIESIQANSPNAGEELYLIYNILAEIAILKENIDNIYLYYERAAENAPSKSKKISTYGKLVLIAETDQDKAKASEYLVRLGDVAPEKIRIDARMKWIIYQRELGNYADVISEIQRMLDMAEFTSEYMQLELELGKVYKSRGDFEMAKEFFGLMVEKYSKKEETAEAYYQLGIMALMEDFNLDLAREYFESSKSEKSSSFYGRESKELINKITHYETLLDIYKESNNNSKETIQIQQDKSTDENDVQDAKEVETYTSGIGKDQEKTRYPSVDLDIGARLGNMGFASQMNEHTTPSVGTSPDSILFMIGEMLLYDFNHLERALENLKMLTLNYPKSKFASQSLYVLSHFQPNEGWHEKLKSDYPHSEFLHQDSSIVDISIEAQIELKRDKAWSLAANSYEESYLEFRRLYDENQDTLSAYISAYISDYYLNDIRRTIEHYLAFADSFPSHSYFQQVDDRLKSIKEDLENQKAIYQQGIDYKHIVQFFQNEKDFDSTKILLDNISRGAKSHYKDAANHLKIVIRNYSELVEEIQTQRIPNEGEHVEQQMAMTKSNPEPETDSLIYFLAELFIHEFEFKDSALYYHQNLVESYTESKFRPYSLLALKELEPGSQWGEILVTDYPDTIFAPDLTVHHLAYHSDIYQDDFLSNKAESIQLFDTYLELFPKLIDSSMFVLDTTINLDDSLLIPKDTMLIPIDSHLLPIDTIFHMTPDTNKAIAP